MGSDYTQQYCSPSASLQSTRRYFVPPWRLGMSQSLTGEWGRGRHGRGSVPYKTSDVFVYARLFYVSITSGGWGFTPKLAKSVERKILLYMQYSLHVVCITVRAYRLEYWPCDGNKVRRFWGLVGYSHFALHFACQREHQGRIRKPVFSSSETQRPSHPLSPSTNVGFPEQTSTKFITRNWWRGFPETACLWWLH